MGPPSETRHKNGSYLGQCPCLPAGQLDPDERTLQRDDVGAIPQPWAARLLDIATLEQYDAIRN